MPQSNHEPSTAETGKQVPVRPHDSGSAANETVDGLDATTEALRHAAEDTPAGAAPDDVEKVPVFDRAGQPTFRIDTALVGRLASDHQMLRSSND
jgi:hypothetical protein